MEQEKRLEQEADYRGKSDGPVVNQVLEAVGREGANHHLHSQVVLEWNFYMQLTSHHNTSTSSTPPRRQVS